MNDLLKVKLLAHTPNPEEVIAQSAKLCYSKVGVDEIMEKLTPEKIEKFLAHLVEIGHESPLEHVTFTFAIEGIDRTCYDKETEVYTDKGWKYFKDLDGTEKILSRNEDGTSSFETPLNYIKYHYKGDLHKYKSKNVDLCVTPNHKMFIKKYDTRTKQQYHLIASEDITVNRFYTTKEIIDIKETSSYFTIPEYSYEKKVKGGNNIFKTLPSLKLNAKNFIKFLAWYISDGNVYYNKEENSYTINITQLKVDDKSLKNIKDIEDIIRSLGFTPYYDGKGIRFKNTQLGYYLKSLGKSYEKYIPQEIFNNIDKEMARYFIETYEKADGTVDKNGCSKLYTTSKILSDQLQMLSFIAGYTGKIYIDNRVGESHYSKKYGKITHNYPCYVLNISKEKRNRNPVIKKDKHMEIIKYDDEVYCVEVPNHVIFVRRNGCCLWCGNCSHQLVRHRLASYSQQSQRYVKLDETFEHTTPNVVKAMGLESEWHDDMMEILDKYIKWQGKIKEYVEENNYPTNGMNAEKVANENARGMLPNACETKLVMTMNARELLHFFSKRCCHRAQEPICELANEMLRLCKEVAPTLFAYAGAPCVRGKCPEGNMTCGNPYKKLV